MISMGVNIHSQNLVNMFSDGEQKKEKKESTSGSAFLTAAASEAIAGKSEVDGVVNFKAGLNEDIREFKE